MPTVKDRVPNRLIHEKAPYLLQHAYNPVNWYPWGKDAFEKAKADDKPVFLSIGYSTWHWCHEHICNPILEIAISMRKDTLLVNIYTRTRHATRLELA